MRVKQAACLPHPQQPVRDFLMHPSTIYLMRASRSYWHLGLLLVMLFLLAAHPASAQNLIGTPEAYDQVGHAVAAGDFNGDAIDDLATGAPGEDGARGSVHITYGSADGLSGVGDEVWSQATPGILGTRESGDRFGNTLAAGDFDGNGIADLAIGVTGESIGAINNAGAVNVIYGQNGGLSTTGNQVWDQGDVIGSAPEVDDRFGEVLVAGDFNGDGYDDLGIGVPFEDLFEHTDAGIVHVIYGSASGLTAAGNEHWTLANTTPFSTDESTLFGHALAAGDFRPALEVPRDELAIGIPGLLVNWSDHAGGVAVLRGVPAGLLAIDEVWTQDSPGLFSSSGPNEQFGWALAAGNFDDDGADDLAISSPFEDVNGAGNAGAVHILYGSAFGFDPEEHSSFWTQDTPFIAETAEDNDYFGWALTTGDFDDDGADDLAIGVQENLSFFGNEGAVNVLFGISGIGLTTSGDRIVHQNKPGPVKDTAEQFDYFGNTLAAGDFDGNGKADLAVGVPGENINGADNAGAVNVVSFSLNQFVRQGGVLRPTPADEVNLLAVADDQGNAAWTSPERESAEMAAQSGAQPEAVVLHGAFPNPFSTATTLRYDLPETAEVRIAVYDALGRTVAEVPVAQKEAGQHAFVLDGTDLPSGVYVVRLVVGDVVQTQRLTLVY